MIPTTMELIFYILVFINIQDCLKFQNYVII